MYGHTAPGALSEYAVRPAQMLHKLPETVSPLEGALVNQGSLTVHALRCAMGDDVYNLVFANGGVSMSAALDADGRMVGGILQPVGTPGR